MATTHTYEISIDGTEFEGELRFEVDPEKMIITTAEPIGELSYHKWAHFLDLMHTIVAVCKTCGEIQKIEVVKK